MARHQQCFLWICLHVIRKSLPPRMRNQIDVWFLHKLNNADAIADFHREMLSMTFPSKDAFMAEYRTRVFDQEYNAIAVCPRQRGLNQDSTSLSFVKKYTKFLEAFKVTKAKTPKKKVQQEEQVAPKLTVKLPHRRSFEQLMRIMRPPKPWER